MKDIEQVGERAEKLFTQGYNCAESVLAAAAESMGLQCDCIPGVATGMGGGLGHTGHACGAVSGAAMAIGLASARKKLADHAAEKRWANELGAEMVAAFKRKFDAVNCRDLIGINFAEAGWAEKYTQKNCKQSCCGFVRFAADWTARRLAKEEV